MPRNKKIKYKSVRVTEDTHKELRKFQKLYGLQNQKDYSLDEIIILLIQDRVQKQFILPVTKDKQEAMRSY